MRLVINLVFFFPLPLINGPFTGKLVRSEGMPREERLTKRQQYALVYSQGRSWVNSLVVMKALPNGFTLSRYGFSVSRQIGKAVARNRVKRLLREILRLTPLEVGWDIIFIARPMASTADYATLRESVRGLLLRAGLLKTVENNSSRVN